MDMKWKWLNCVWLFVTPWTIQAMEFSSPECRSVQPFPSSGDLPNPGIKPRFPGLQADSLSAEPQGKPKNTGGGSLSLLQCIFLTQELNWGLLHCRWILYKLSYPGSPFHGYFCKVQNIPASGPEHLLSGWSVFLSSSLASLKALTTTPPPRPLTQKIEIFSWS